MFITTGLLKYTPSYEALVGVLAHEIGHLQNFHIAKRIDSINNLKSLNQLGNLSVIASSIFTNNANYLLQSMIANQVGIKNYYNSFSKNQEREADIYAIKTLNQLKLSEDPLIDFLKILERKSFQKGLSEENFQFLTHPVYKERFEIIENFKSNEEKFSDNELNERFLFMQAKLFGFTEKNNFKLQEHLHDDYFEYAKSIILARNGKLKESLLILNKLINKYPENFFLIETKADLLLAHGYSNEAKKFYEIVLKNYKNNYYVKKRVFEIEYADLNENKDKINIDFFENYNDLMLIFRNNIILFEKFKKLTIFLEIEDWLYFIDGSIDLMNQQNELAIMKFEYAFQQTKNKKLKKLIKEKIILAKNE